MRAQAAMSALENKADMTLMANRLSTQLLQKPAHCVKLRAEARQSPDFNRSCLIVVVKRLARQGCSKGRERRSR
jgi:hypothetical protein